MKWAIIFPDNYLGYSPSCINFVKLLEKYGQDYLVFHLDDGSYDNSKLTIKNCLIDENIFFTKPLNFPIIFLKIFKRFNNEKLYKILLIYFYVKKCHKKEHFDKFVGFDDCGYFSAYLINKNAYYYSLEISKSIYNRFIFFFLNVKLLIIQSEERKNYLSLKNINTIYIQNSPVSSLEKIKNNIYQSRLIYFGTIYREHGVEYCINCLYTLTEETLMIKGVGQENNLYINYLQQKYNDLIINQRLFFDFSYIDQDDVIMYLQNYDIGFCFYDYKIINKNNFNYISSPSGKMFNYFAAGLPVIGSDSIGLAPVKKSNAGVLLNNLNIDEIKNAINIIKTKYSVFQKNANNASIEYDYANMFEKNKEKILCSL